jgi:mannose-6-phosphate isomerase-like protein (cupin superfamily)
LATEYETLKLQLAQDYGNDVAAYTGASERSSPASSKASVRPSAAIAVVQPERPRPLPPSSNPLGRALAETQRGPAGWRLNSRIAAVPFTLRNLKGDLEDLGSNFDGAPDLEFRFASKALELEQSGLSYQRIPPDYRFPYGHTHKEQEEVYVVVRGSGRMKLDDEIVEVKEWDVVRVPPGTWRGYEGGPEGLEILVFGAPNLGENPRDDVEGQRDWWAD